MANADKGRVKPGGQPDRRLKENKKPATVKRPAMPVRKSKS